MSILSFILYCKYGILRSLYPVAGEFRNDAGRSLARNSTDAKYAEKVQSAHSAISAKSRFLISRKHKGDTPLLSQSFFGKLKYVPI